AIADDLIFDRLTLVESIEAGTFDGGDMDEHVFAAALGLNESVALRRIEPFDSSGRHHRLLECTNLIASARPSCGRSSDSVVLSKPYRHAATSNASSNSLIIPLCHEGFNRVRTAAAHGKFNRFTRAPTRSRPGYRRHALGVAALNCRGRF